MSKVDKIKVEYSSKNMFKGRSITILDDRGNVTSSIPVPDDAILCDFCNEKIDTFPVCVVGDKAVCSNCRKDLERNDVNNEIEW